VRTTTRFLDGFLRWLRQTSEQRQRARTGIEPTNIRMVAAALGAS
jgi:hypothetical protein